MEEEEEGGDDGDDRGCKHKSKEGGGKGEGGFGLPNMVSYNGVINAYAKSLKVDGERSKDGTGGAIDPVN